MNIRDRAIEAIRELPHDADIQQVIREVAFIGGVEKAVDELDRGEGMTSQEAKEKLKECLAR